MKSRTQSAESLVERLTEAAQAIERSATRTGRSTKAVMSDAADASEQVIAREWAALRRDLSELATHTDLNDFPEVRAVIDRIRDSIDTTTHSVERVAHRARASAEAGMSQVDEYVHDAPWKVAGFAALAGIALGLMISRR